MIYQVGYKSDSALIWWCGNGFWALYPSGSLFIFSLPSQRVYFETLAAARSMT
jgi:hypothetical protein